MAYYLYLGCIIPNLFPEIERATRDILAKLNVEFSDMKGASCCAPPGLLGVHRDSWLVLNRRNLSMADGVIITPCDECFASLQDARGILSESIKDLPEVKPLPQFISGNLQSIGEKFQGGLNLKCAVQHSCHLLRPSETRKVDDPEAPKLIADLLNAIGCERVVHEDELACCGGLIYEGSEVGIKLAMRKVDACNRSGADCVVTTCAHCLRQLRKVSTTMPILHLAQLYALATGSEPSSIGIPDTLRMSKR